MNLYREANPFGCRAKRRQDENYNDNDTIYYDRCAGFICDRLSGA